MADRAAAKRTQGRRHALRLCAGAYWGDREIAKIAGRKGWGSRLKNEIPSAFTSFQGFARRKISLPVSPRQWIGAREPAGRRSHVNARDGSSRPGSLGDADRASRLAHPRSTFRGPSRGLGQNRDSLRILRVFKALQGGKFPMRRQSRSPPQGRKRIRLSASRSRRSVA